MTPAQIMAEYTRREREANARPQGADVGRIIRDVAEWAGLPFAEVDALVKDYSAMRPN